MNPYPAAAFRVPSVEAWNRRQRPVTDPAPSAPATGLLDRMRAASSAGRRARRVAGTAAG